jgi:hypothetical protein
MQRPPHVTVRAANYVRHHVDRWVRANRKAGPDARSCLATSSVNFGYSPSHSAADSEPDHPESQSDAMMAAQLDKAWCGTTTSKLLDRTGTHRSLWRHYQEVLPPRRACDPGRPP